MLITIHTTIFVLMFFALMCALIVVVATIFNYLAFVSLIFIVMYIYQWIITKAFQVTILVYAPHFLGLVWKVAHGITDRLGW